MLKWILGWPYALYFHVMAQKAVWNFFHGLPKYKWGTLADLPSDCGRALNASDLESIGQVVFIPLSEEDNSLIQKEYPAQYWN